MYLIRRQQQEKDFDKYQKKVQPDANPMQNLLTLTTDFDNPFYPLIRGLKSFSLQVKCGVNR